MKQLLVALIAAAFTAGAYAQAQKAEPKGQTGTETQKAEPAKKAAKKTKKTAKKKAAAKKGEPAKKDEMKK